MSANDHEFLQVGEIIGSRGLDGEMKIRPYTESPERFYDFDTVFIKGKEVPIRGITVQKDKVYLKVRGIYKKNTVDKLRGEFISIRKDSSELEEGEYFLVDLIGNPVFDINSNELGKLIDITQTSGPVDIFVIKTKDKTLYVPGLKEYFTIQDDLSILADIPEEFFDL